LEFGVGVANGLGVGVGKGVGALVIITRVAGVGVGEIVWEKTATVEKKYMKNPSRTLFFIILLYKSWKIKMKPFGESMNLHGKFFVIRVYKDSRKRRKVVKSVRKNL
jgi:hypothetical protein